MTTMPAPSWESQIAALLNHVSATQDSLFSLLARKRELLVAADVGGLAALVPEEEALVDRLQACLRERETLLAAARSEGRRVESVQELAQTLPATRRTDLPRRLSEAASKARILQHQSLTN